MIFPVVLCGGSGTRLWPASRKGYPKQFSRLLGDESLYQASLRRLSGEGFAEPVYYGVHGGIKNFYKVDPEKEHAATLDHIVGAVGG